MRKRPLSWWKGRENGVGDGGIADLVVDVHVEVSLGLKLRQFLDLASFLDEKGAVSEDVGKSSGDFVLNL